MKDATKTGTVMFIQQSSTFINWVNYSSIYDRQFFKVDWFVFETIEEANEEKNNAEINRLGVRLKTISFF